MSQGKYLILSGKNIKEDKIVTTDRDRYADYLPDRRFANCVLQTGDIVVSLIFTDRKIYIYKENDSPAVVGYNCSIIRTVNNKYIKTYLQTKEGKEIFTKQADRKITGSVIPHLTLRDFKSIKIPIIPIEDLNSISDEAIKTAQEDDLRELKLELTIWKEKYYKIEEKTKERESLEIFLENRIGKIYSQLKVIENKVDKVLIELKSLQSELNYIKKLPRDDEERLFRMYKAIDDKLEQMIYSKKKDIEFYIKDIQRWLDYWDLLDEISKNFLPSAEFLYDEISKMESIDYSPFVIQYCRTIENEILKKIFNEYHENITTNVDDINELIEEGLNNEKTKKFAKYLKNDRRDYTLGEMNWIMNLIKKSGNTLSSVEGQIYSPVKSV